MWITSLLLARLMTRPGRSSCLQRSLPRKCQSAVNTDITRLGERGVCRPARPRRDPNASRTKWNGQGGISITIRERARRGGARASTPIARRNQGRWQCSIEFFRSSFFSFCHPAASPSESHRIDRIVFHRQRFVISSHGQARAGSFLHGRRLDQSPSACTRERGRDTRREALPAAHASD